MESLPTEITAHILSNLEPNFDTLILVCQKWKDIIDQIISQSSLTIDECLYGGSVYHFKNKYLSTISQDKYFYYYGMAILLKRSKLASLFPREEFNVYQLLKMATELDHAIIIKYLRSIYCPSFADHLVDYTTLSSSVAKPNPFSYTPYNHICGIIRSLDNDASIPKDIVDLIRKDIEGYSIDYGNVKDCLSIRGLRKYYEKIPQIVALLAGIQIRSEDIGVILKTFKIIYPVYKKLSPNRFHINSYFMINKICGILELDGYSILFPETIGHIKMQDWIWENICRYLNYPIKK